eukprot:380416-Amphidinium_carterae.1
MSGFECCCQGRVEVRGLPCTPEELLQLLRGASPQHPGTKVDTGAHDMMCLATKAFLVRLAGKHLPAWVDRFGQMALSAANNLDGIVNVDRAISVIGHAAKLCEMSCVSVNAALCLPSNWHLAALFSYLEGLTSQA